MNSRGISAYFFAGDFVEAARRFLAGEPQSYATHDELIRTFRDIGAAGFDVDIYSFAAPRREAVTILPRVRVTGLGASNHRDPCLIKAFDQDSNGAVICHFPSIALHYAIWRSNKRALSVMASSFNKTTLRARLLRRLLRFFLNSRRFDFVSNHCAPSTALLARAGVRRDKLIPWNIPLTRHPRDHAAKSHPGTDGLAVCYVGSISEEKGVGDLVRGIAAARGRGLPVRCTIAGGGDIASLSDMTRQLGVADDVIFAGAIDNTQAFDLMRDSDVIVVPSRSDFEEGFPLVLFEAIASRTPILCSDHPIFSAAFTHERDALIFRERDHEQMADRLARLIADHTLYATLSTAAITTWQRLDTSADWGTMLREWVEHGKNSIYLQRNTLAVRQ